MKRKSLQGLILVSLACLIAGCGTVAKSYMKHDKRFIALFESEEMDRSINGSGSLEYTGEGTNRITVLHLTATNYYSLGYHHGQLLGPEIKVTYENILDEAEKKILGKAYKMLTKAQRRKVLNYGLDKGWDQMKAYVPREDMEEMTGLADGSGIDLKTIHRVHALADISQSSCSALVANNTATIDGHVMQLRQLDYGIGTNLCEHPLVIVYNSDQPGVNSYTTFGWIGFVGQISGINEKGLCVSEMHYRKTEKEVLTGQPMIFLMKHVMRFANDAEQASAIIRSARRNNAYAYWIGDPQGNAIGMLTGARNFRMFKVNEQKELMHGDKVYPQFTGVIYAGQKEDDQAKMINDSLGKIDLAKIKEIAKKIAMKSNLQTVIFDLTTQDAWIANRHGTNRAADCEYILFPRSAWDLKK